MFNINLMSNFHKDYMSGLESKVNFLNQLANSNQRKTFDYANAGYANTFYNNQENGLVGSRPNRPSDYTTQSQRVASSAANVKLSNQYVQSAGKSLSGTKSAKPRK